MKKNKKVKKGVISTQIFAMSILTIFLIALIIASIVTKETVWIIASIIYTIEYALMLLHEINIIKEAAGYKVKKNPIYMWLFIFILILTILVIFSVALVDKISVRSNSVKTEATIYKIDKEINYRTAYDENGNSYEVEEKECKKHIVYEVDGKEYKGVMSEVSCNHSEDDIVIIYYEKGNPSIFIDPDDIFFTGLGVTISVIALLAFILSTIGDLKKQKKKTKKE